MNAHGIQQRENERSEGLTARGLAERNLAEQLTDVALGYQRALAANPRNVEALVGMSLVALGSRQTKAAITMAAAALAVASPGTRLQAAAWVTMGQALKADGRYVQAGTGLRSGDPAGPSGCAGAVGTGRVAHRPGARPASSA